MKYLKSKKVLISLLIVTATIGAITAAKLSSKKTVMKDMNFSTNQLIGMKEKPIIETKKNENPLLFDTTLEMVDFYSKVFELNSEIIYNKINEIINLDLESWTILNKLNGVEYKSKDEAILRTVYDIYQNPSKYALDNNSIKSNKGYELSNYKPEELVYKFSTVLDVNPQIALAIAYCECGYKLNSYNFVNKHNIGGIRGNGGFVKFKNEAYGIFKYVLMLRNGYNVTIESGIDKIVSMAQKYCGGSQHWISVVSNYYNDLNNNGFEFYYNKSQHDRSLNIPYIEKDTYVE
ncbi:MAG: hypothetical protein K6G37_00435 [Bacilli bacterium]|nr:hypothetical protein [Bacilli bacterium]